MPNSLNYHSWLEVSQEDLQASKLLFDNQFYPQAIFYFQQAVEKLIKYIGLENNIIQEKETRKISHISSKIFKKAIKQVSPHIDLNLNVDMDFEKMNKFITNNPEAIVVPKVIEQIQNTFQQKNKSPFDNVETLEEFYEITKRWYPDDPNLKEFELISKDENMRPYLNKIFRNFKNRHYSHSNGIVVLFILNTLTETFVTKARYPEKRNPSKIYNIHNPLVKALPYFFQILEKNIEIFKFG